MTITIDIHLHPEQGDIAGQLDDHMKALGFVRAGISAAIAAPYAGATQAEDPYAKVVTHTSTLNPIKVPDEPITDDQAATLVATAKTTRERGKPSPGHARRTKAEIAEDEAADKADAAVKQAGEEHGGIVADKVVEVQTMVTLPEDSTPAQVAEAFAGLKGAISDSPENRAGPEDDEATAEQDAADEAAETAANSNGVKTLDDVRAALGKYVTKFGMAAAQEDGPKVLGMVCGEGVSKISAIPDDKIVAVIAGIEEMTAKNPFRRQAA